MPIKLEVSGENPAEFGRELAGALIMLSRVTVSSTKSEIIQTAEPVRHATEPPITGPLPEEPAPPEPKKTRKPRATPAKTGGDMPDERPEEVAEVTGEAESEAAPTYTIDDVRGTLMKVLEKHGDAVPPAILAGFGASKISALRPSDFAGVMKLAGDALSSDVWPLG